MKQPNTRTITIERNGEQRSVKFEELYFDGCGYRAMMYMGKHESELYFMYVFEERTRRSIFRKREIIGFEKGKQFKNFKVLFDEGGQVIWCKQYKSVEEFKTRLDILKPFSHDGGKKYENRLYHYNKCVETLRNAFKDNKNNKGVC